MKQKPTPHKLHLAWLIKMAWRDANASKVRLILFMASIILGIAAVVSIQMFSINLQDNIQRQSKTLMGADFVINSKQEPTGQTKNIIDSLQPSASEISFLSMVSFSKGEGTKLVQVRGLQGDFPIYGNIETEPINAGHNYSEGALVDATLLLQFNIRPGDSIKIGALSVPIIGALKALPGNTVLSSAIAPTVIIPQQFVEATQLLQYGSRKEFQFFYKSADTTNLTNLEKILQPKLDVDNARIDTHLGATERLGKRYENVNKFLSLAAFIALLLGCIGIASAVHIYIKEKIRAIAILKCLGASRFQSMLIYSIQISGVGIVGGLIGSLIGLAVQDLFPYLLKNFLPFDIVMRFSFQPMLIGVFLGFSMSVLFALLPLLKTWFVSPLEVLRVNEKTFKEPVWIKMLVFGLILLFLLFFSWWLLDDFRYAIFFLLASLFTFVALAGTALGIIKLIKLFYPKNGSFTIRQSLLNLFRPNNQTVVLIVAIGLGSFLISTLYFSKELLLNKTEIGQNDQSANIIVLDVQPKQTQNLKESFKENHVPIIDNIPMVTMRMHSINGQLVNDIRRDSTRQIRTWILNHEFRTTYRDTLTPSEELIEGVWIPHLDANDPIVISISDNLAADADLELGDPVVFNVQGVLMPTTVGSIRKVDWAQMQLNFTIVFPSGVLEQAPQFNVFTTKVHDEVHSAALQKNLVKDFPNVTIIDLRQVFTMVDDILEQVAWVINFMAFFSILTGVIVLIGSVRTSKYQRIRESVLLRTLGAKNKQILKITFYEYFFLGLLGSLVGFILALIASAILAYLLFQESLIWSWIPFLVFLPGITLLVLIIGLSNVRGVLRSSPLKVLRREN